MTAAIVGPGGAVAVHDGVDVTRLATVDSTGALKVTGTFSGSGATDVSDRAGRLVGEVSLNAASLAALESVDVYDRAGRILGVVTLDSFSLAALESIDVTDRSGRIVGQVTLDTASLNALANVNVTDRAGRLMGHVTVDNFPTTVAVTSLPEVGLAKDVSILNKFGQITPTAVTATVTATTIVAPANGSRLRVLWLYAQADAGNVNAVLVTFKLGSNVLYRCSLEASQPWAHGAVIDGAVNEALSVDLSASQTVYVNSDTRQF